MDDPWWITAARILALVGMSYGAYEGFRRMRAEKTRKDQRKAADSAAGNETSET